MFSQRSQYQSNRISFSTIFLSLILLAALGGGAYYALNLTPPPQIVAHWPEGDAQNVSPRTAIEITFDQPMDQGSVQNNILITPLVKGDFVWLDEVTFRFEPAEKWAGLITVELLADAQSLAGAALQAGATWQFSTHQPRIAYIDTFSSNREPGDVWSVLLDGTDPQQLTDEAEGVLAFGVHPSGERLVYSVTGLGNATQIKEINLNTSVVELIQECVDAFCTNPSYSPNGDWIAFERQAADGATNAASSVVLLELANRQLRDLPFTAEDFTQTPVWLDSDRLAFINLQRREIGWYSIAENRLTYVPDLALEMGSWSPDGLWVVFPEVVLDEADLPELVATPTALVAAQEPTADAVAPTPTTQAFVTAEDVVKTYLLRHNVLTNEVLAISKSEFVEDTEPVFSWTGDRIAFARKFVENDVWTPGRQLWVMNGDGSGAEQLTDEPIFNHANFLWTPDDQTIVFLRFNVTVATAAPEIWAIDRDGENLRQLARGAFSPAWVP